MKYRNHGISYDFETTVNFDDIDIRVEIEGYRPGDPGRISGPPEKCYPPEGPDYEVKGISLIVHKLIDGKKQKVFIPLPDEMAEMIIGDMGELISEEGENALRSEYDDAMERKYDEWVERKNDERI